MDLALREEENRDMLAVIGDQSDTFLCHSDFLSLSTDEKCSQTEVCVCVCVCVSVPYLNVLYIDNIQIDVTMELGCVYIFYLV